MARRAFLVLLLSLAQAAHSGESRIELDVLFPAAETVIDPLEPALLIGNAFVELAVDQGLDVVLAIDVSTSTGIFAGADIDGDGIEEVAKIAGDDSVIAAELLAAERVIDELVHEGHHLAIVRFSGESPEWWLTDPPAEVVQPLTSDGDKLRRALQSLIDKPLGMTDIAAALNKSIAALGADRRPQGACRIPVHRWGSDPSPQRPRRQSPGHHRSGLVVRKSGHSRPHFRHWHAGARKPRRSDSDRRFDTWTLHACRAPRRPVRNCRLGSQSQHRRCASSQPNYGRGCATPPNRQGRLLECSCPCERGPQPHRGCGFRDRWRPCETHPRRSGSRGDPAAVGPGGIRSAPRVASRRPLGANPPECTWTLRRAARALRRQNGADSRRSQARTRDPGRRFQGSRSAHPITAQFIFLRWLSRIGASPRRPWSPSPAGPSPFGSYLLKHDISQFLLMISVDLCISD